MENQTKLLANNLGLNNLLRRWKPQTNNPEKFSDMMKRIKQ